MKNVHMCYIGVTEGKIENLKKEGKMMISILIFIYTIHFAYLKMYTNLKTLALKGAEKSVTEISIGEKEKWTMKNKKNKATDKQYMASFCNTLQLITIKLCTKFQCPKSSSCWNLWQKKKFTEQQTDWQTHIITEKAKSIYPLYTSYRGYN